MGNWPGKNVKFSFEGFMSLFSTIGFSLQFLLGLSAVILPGPMARILGFGTPLSLGVTEVRATHGAFFLVLALGGLAVSSSDISLVVGAAWAAASFCRFLSLIVEPNDRFKNIAGVLVEGVIAVFLLVGARS